jgi:hypothetical protein
VGSARHLERGAPCESQQQETVRVGAVQDQIRHPMNECLGLARARAGRDQQGRRRPSVAVDAVFDRAALRRIQFAQILVAIDVCQRGVPRLFP